MGEETLTAEQYFERGIANWKNGKFEEAIADYDKAIALDPKLALAYNNRGTAKSDLGRKEEAIADYDKAIALDPKLPQAYYNRGNAKGGLGRKEEAIADYDKAIALDPKLALAYNNRGNAKGGLGRKEAAIADYDKAIALDPKWAPAYYNRGNAKGDLGRKEEAIADYKTVIQFADPSDTVWIARAKQFIKDLSQKPGKGKAVSAKKEVPPPSLERLPMRETTRAAVMFIDICGSTHTMEVHGVEHFLSIFDALDKMVEDMNAAHSWFFKKGLGDGFMLAYTERMNAVQGALLLLEKVSMYNASVHDDLKMDIRIGMDFGPVERTHDKDCFGMAVNKASRIEGLQKKQFLKKKHGLVLPVNNRLLVSNAVYKCLEENVSFKCTLLGQANLKGVDGGPCKIYRIERA